MTRATLIDGRRLSDVRRPDRPLTLKGRSAHLLPHDDPAIVERRTTHQHMVVTAGEHGRWALKTGANNRKLGGEVTVGRWSGMPIYALTLEERRTCPQTCKHLRSCYGQDTDRAHRMKSGPALEARLAAEVKILDIRHVKGFVVRLHVLGDFYSVEYVELWRRLLRQYPTLHVWGYTARIDVVHDPIAAALASVMDEFGWSRFAVRLSDAPTDLRSTIVVECEHHKPPGATVCRQETDDKQNCGACGLCWESQKRIAFIQH